MGTLASCEDRIQDLHCLLRRNCSCSAEKEINIFGEI